MDIKGLPKEKVLIALYEGARVQGMGFLQAKKEPITDAEATDLLNKYKYFDYLYGRVMKIDLSKDEVDTRLYNRDNGEGAAERIVEALR